MPGRPRTLKLALPTAATPQHVRDVAELFAASLRAINPELGDDVTLVVSNFALNAELRGLTTAGKRAVDRLMELVANPTRAVQRHPELTGAALTLAEKSQPLVQHEPRFLDPKDEEVGRIDDVFVRTLSAAGRQAVSVVAGEPSGDTVVHSRVLRVGRQRDGGPLKVRIELWGRACEVDVAPAVSEAALWDLAKSGEVARLRVRGAWVRASDGLLELKSPEVESVDATFQRWTGKELLDDVRENAHLFSRASFDRMLEEYEEQRED